jgi:ribosomal protein L37AE/L43A
MQITRINLIKYLFIIPQTYAMNTTLFKSPKLKYFIIPQTMYSSHSCEQTCAITTVDRKEYSIWQVNETVKFICLCTQQKHFTVKFFGREKVSNVVVHVLYICA